jgi:hypothetical protein
MAQKLLTSVENNFTKGFVTEFTGLNFPENAATETDNCEYTLIGNVLRREGIDFEENFQTQTVDKTNKAITTYKWNNAGGDGLTEIVVTQIGSFLYFYRSSEASITAPLSNQLLASSIDIEAYKAAGNPNDPSQTECQYTAGNGYLFVFHPDLDPFYCTYTDATVSAAAISLQIRDFTGVVEDGIPDNLRPATLTAIHEYNLTNQGWTSGGPWQATSTTTVLGATGPRTFTVAAGLGATVGQHVKVYYTGGDIYQPSGSVAMSGNVSSYVGTQLTIAITSVSSYVNNQSLNSWSLSPNVNGYINAWNSALGNYPSNSDVWWRFKDSNNVFSPATTFANVTLSTGPAPKGHYILSAFDQQRDLVASISGITDITTFRRPRTGTWFQGRVFYAGVDDSQSATGNAKYYTWTENIYFSQIVETAEQFGKCFQLNDPTSEDLSLLLPTDGGVITIAGCGSIFNLFPIQNGMLIFAANGIWFLTGSQGIGFSAVDYTITKISNVKSISSSSFVDVMGLPYFWNEEGIYQVSPQQGGGLTVEPITVSTILSYYEDIPLSSKKYVKASYHPIDYVIQWCFKSEEETDITSRYQFDKIMNYNIYNKAFYPYTVAGDVTINGIQYVSGPGGQDTPLPTFKYLVSKEDGTFTFADQHDTDYVDWASDTPDNYSSYFITGYKVHGKGLYKFGVMYLNTISDCTVSNAYTVQGIWDYYTDPNSGRFSAPQFINNIAGPTVRIRRSKIRGRGYVLQFKVASVDGRPFNLIGWSLIESQDDEV